MKLFRHTASVLALCMLSVSCVAVRSTPAVAAGTQYSELDRLVVDVCQKQIVLLGEANHFTGITLETKVAVAKRLIDECNFSAVLFEGQIYDFLDLERSFSMRTATIEQVADAIGGLWSLAKESDPLISFLYERASAGRVRLGGIDPNVASATAFYSSRLMDSELASYLEGDRQVECKSALHKLTNWQYDQQNPYDDVARIGLRACVEEIQVGISKQFDGNASYAERMATNISWYLEMSSADALNVRDRAMYNNLQWYFSRWPRDSKVIVWCANVHAAKNLPSVINSWVPLGAYVHQSFGARAVAIGITALSGSYAYPGQKEIKSLPVESSDSVEFEALSVSKDDLRYMDYRQLKNAGNRSANILGYDKPVTHLWSEVLDGLIVLREERPPQYVYDRKPRQLNVR